MAEAPTLLRFSSNWTRSFPGGNKETKLLFAFKFGWSLLPSLAQKSHFSSHPRQQGFPLQNPRVPWAGLGVGKTHLRHWKERVDCQGWLGWLLAIPKQYYIPEENITAASCPWWLLRDKPGYFCVWCSSSFLWFEVLLVSGVICSSDELVLTRNSLLVFLSLFPSFKNMQNVQFCCSVSQKHNSCCTCIIWFRKIIPGTGKTPASQAALRDKNHTEISWGLGGGQCSLFNARNCLFLL